MTYADRIDAHMPRLSQLTRALMTPLEGFLEARVPTPEVSPPQSALRQQHLSPRLVIPTCERSREETEQGWHHSQGLHLARQERWEDLSHLICQFDMMRATTAGGTPVPALLAQGARADTVRSSHPPGSAKALQARQAGVLELDLAAQEHPQNAAVALVAILAHIDLGWAFRGEGWTSEVAVRDHESFALHFDRANTLLDIAEARAAQQPQQKDMPPVAALAAARCAALPGSERPSAQVIDCYDRLISLDAGAPTHMRAFGNHLLPRWFGTYELLNLEARRMAVKTQDTWGNGGYAWTYMDALLVDERAYEGLDTDYFLDGVRDILTHRPEQHLANIFAAYLGVATRSGAAKTGDTVAINRARARLIAGFRWVLQDHLREVHPLIWAEAADRFAPNPGPLADRAALVRRGRAAAFSRISEVFAHVMAEGQIVRFDPEGIVYSPAP